MKTPVRGLGGGEDVETFSKSGTFLSNFQSLSIYIFDFQFSVEIIFDFQLKLNFFLDITYTSGLFRLPPDRQGLPPGSFPKYSMSIIGRRQ